MPCALCPTPYATEAAAVDARAPRTHPTHLLLHLAQKRPQRGVAPDELLDGSADPSAVQAGLVVAEAGDARQLVVAHLLRLRGGARVEVWGRVEVWVRVSVGVRVKVWVRIGVGVSDS